MRALVIGVDGLIGKALFSALQRKAHVAYGTTRKGAPAKDTQVRKLDLSAPDVRGLPKVDIAYFCAAMTGFSECRSDPGLARQINVHSTERVATQLAQQGTRVALLSTSAVFDCTVPRMASDRAYDPRGIYGATKAEAEASFLRLGSLACVLRIAKVLTAETVLIRRWIDCLVRGQPVEAFHDVTISPLTLESVVDALVALGAQPQGGIFQISGSADISYADIALRLASRLDAPAELVHACSATERGIPANEVTRYTSLDTTRAAQLLGFAAPSPQAVLDAVFGPILANCRTSPSVAQ